LIYRHKKNEKTKQEKLFSSNMPGTSTNLRISESNQIMLVPADVNVDPVLICKDNTNLVKKGSPPKTIIELLLPGTHFTSPNFPIFASCIYIPS
jgi:hypothetical protein